MRRQRAFNQALRIDVQNLRVPVSVLGLREPSVHSQRSVKDAKVAALCQLDFLAPAGQCALPQVVGVEGGTAGEPAGGSDSLLSLEVR